MNSISSKRISKNKVTSLYFSYLEKSILVTYRTDSDDMVEVYFDNVIKTRIERNGDTRSIDFSVGDTIHSIEIWFKKEQNIMFVNTGINGPGILVDGIPVENTLADKSFYINNARMASIAFFILLLIKTGVSFIQNMKLSVPLLLNIVNISVYIVAIVLIIITIVKFKKHPKFGSYMLAVICGFETIDYLIGVYLSIIGGQSILGASVLIFTSIRISFIIVSVKSLQQIYKANRNSQI